jgi:hypothetical protein
MAVTESVDVTKLGLDLANFRTVKQSDEVAAIKSMITINPGRFWGLMESLLEDEYLPTENILVLKNSDKTLIVKEGNRRIACLKLILGIIPITNLNLRDDLRKKINSVAETWKANNSKVPCNVYEIDEIEIVDKIVARTHGKGENAGRADWTAVATARHNRDASGMKEFGLDILEKFLLRANNVTRDEINLWAGDYPLTVLNEALRKTFKRFQVLSLPDLITTYPNIVHIDALDAIIYAIGGKEIGFKEVRADDDFAVQYGLPENIGPTTQATGPTQSTSTPAANVHTSQTSTQAGSGNTTSSQSGSTQTNQGTSQKSTPKKSPAVALNDPRSVIKALKNLIINSTSSNNRGKVVLLKNEAIGLNLDKHPMAFCFLLRSMFEISAKAYCDDYKSSGAPSPLESNGNDKKLAKLLGEIHAHMISNSTDKIKVKHLNGAKTEISKPDGILSVTSLNQLIHNQNSCIGATDIAIAFNKILPLLTELCA